MNLLFTQFFFDFKQIQVTTKVIKGSKISTPNKKDEMHQIETLKVEDTRNPKGSLLYLLFLQKFLTIQHQPPINPKELYKGDFKL
jgi:hypothetical protein